MPSSCLPYARRARRLVDWRGSALILLLLLCAPGCDRLRRLTGRDKGAGDGGTVASAAGDGGAKGEHDKGEAKDEHDKGEAKDGHDKGEAKDEHAEGDHGADGGAAPGGGSDVEAEYTPRRLTIDEEDCDDVTREALSHLREQAQALAERQKVLVEREGALKAREQAQARAATQVEERVKELTRLAGEIDERMARGARPPGADPARLAESKARREQKVQQVARMVAGMAAQRAASLLGEFQDDDLAAAVLQSLPQETAGKVLGQMRPASAARLAERMGGDKEGARP